MIILTNRCLIKRLFEMPSCLRNDPNPRAAGALWRRSAKNMIRPSPAFWAPSADFELTKNSLFLKIIYKIVKHLEQSHLQVNEGQVQLLTQWCFTCHHGYVHVHGDDHGAHAHASLHDLSETQRHDTPEILSFAELSIHLLESII